MILRALLLAVAGVALASVATRAFAQAQQQSSPPTLAQALATAAPPDPGQVVLTVGGDRLKLPGDAQPLGIAPEFPLIAADYAQALQSFDMVSAIAPPTMTVLNPPPAEPNIYANLSALQAFTLLASTLSESQWQQMISVAGLPVSDLQTDQQKQLFQDLLSHDGKLILSPKYEVGETWNEKDKIDETDLVPQARLRLGQTVTLMLPAKDSPSYYPGSQIPPPENSPRIYRVDDRNDYGGSSDVVGGARVREDVPNVPKQSQLDYSSRTFQASVPLTGIKTVGDLIARISIATHVEIYADKRLETQPVTYIGASAARAADLLQALALCVAGTYRQVGPAFVLTNDIVGVGTLHQLWMEFDQVTQTLLSGPITQASNSLYARHSPKDLSWFDDPGAYSPDQMNSSEPNRYHDPKMLPTLNLPISKLTPAQQQIVQRAVAAHNAMYTLQPATADKDITVSPGLSAQLILPGIDQPVDLYLNMGSVDQTFLFQSPPNPQHVAALQHNDGAAANAPPVAGVSALVAALKAGLHRAVIVHPRTAAGVDADIAAMKALGLNEMWLDVFSDGAAHVPGSGLTHLPHPLKPGENDILTEAIDKGRASGIAIYPVMDLLFWGQEPPDDAVDMNVLGESSAQAAARWWQLWAMAQPPRNTTTNIEGDIIPNFTGIAVAPLSRTVYAPLAVLVRTIAHRPGIAGIVWRGEDPPGYDAAGNGLATSSLLLGYSVPTRLAFLRQDHVDPIDVWPSGQYAGLANTDVTYFDDQSTYKLNQDWTEFRADVHLRFLRSLYASINPAGSAAHVPIIVKQLRPGRVNQFDASNRPTYADGWYGSWDDPAKSPPTLHGWGDENPPGQPYTPTPPSDDQAKQQSRAFWKPWTKSDVDRYALVFSFYANSPEKRARFMRAVLASDVVLDLSDSPFGDNGNGSDPLTDLAADLSPGTTKIAPAVSPR